MTPDFLAGYDQALDDARRWGWRRPDRSLLVAVAVVMFIAGVGVGYWVGVA